MDATHDVIVVGGGQAGLALGYHLAQQRRPFTILDAGDADYARDFVLPVELNTRVRAVQARRRGYLVETDKRAYEAEQVVIATGPFQTPRIPSIATNLAAEVHQLHSSDYRRPQDIADGPVLVVGGGNTGFQIAHELAVTNAVHLAIGSRQTPLPQRLFGRDLFTILTATGLMGKTVDSRLGRRLSGRDALIGSSPRAIRRHGVSVRPRATSGAGSTITFADGSTLEPRTVIWATGFGVDHTYIHAPVFGDDGDVQHARGVTPAPGLCFLGMPWQHTRGSALLGWVKDDARHIAEEIATLATVRAAVQPATAVRT